MQTDMVRLTQFEHEREQLWLRALAESPDGLTQAKLAELVGMSPGHISRRLERARRLKANPEELHQMELIESPNPFATHGCELHHLIRVGTLRICLRCGKGGMDHASPFRGAHSEPMRVKPSEDQPDGTPTFKPKAKKLKSATKG